ncbi:hypothetical protein NDU88_002978 [Pleurodeles waltl]|uniref:Uncharacterized protein n=1 Tax=Pleurodeles waltl TaxID=8319 RepID=A0AAV7UCP4_PLEWA|nr:hypothetical protein NDU88_002978 [Pleurodeles waltl]
MDFIRPMYGLHESLSYTLVVADYLSTWVEWLSITGVAGEHPFTIADEAVPTRCPPRPLYLGHCRCRSLPSAHSCRSARRASHLRRRYAALLGFSASRYPRSSMTPEEGRRRSTPLPACRSTHIGTSEGIGVCINARWSARTPEVALSTACAEARPGCSEAGLFT